MEVKDLKYHVGFGVCKEYFQIEEKNIAAFVNLQDAESYIKYNYLYEKDANKKVYYIDEINDLGNQKVRSVYDFLNEKFIKGSEVVSGNNQIFVIGYELYSTYKNDWGEDKPAWRKCFSYDDAEKIRKKWKDEGYDHVHIYEDEKIDVMWNLFKAKEFFLGNLEASNSQEQFQEYDEIGR